MLVSDEIDIVLIGTVSLEILSFEIDPMTRKVKEAKIYLL
jgi:predicted aspartyl protease